MRDTHQPILSIAFWIAVGILTLAVMAPGLHGGFQFDDDPNIVENAAIQINTLNLATLKASTKGLGAGPLGRPVSVASFALTHYFFALNPFAFKAINLVLHLINGLLLAWLLALLLPIPGKPQLSEKNLYWLPHWVAGIWLLHPINLLPVMLSVQRMTLLAGMFMLLALIGHIKAVSTIGRAKWIWLAMSWLLFWPLSVLSKETGLLFPLFVLLITFLRQPPAVATAQRISPVIVLAGLSVPAIGLAMLSYLGTGWLDNAYAMRPFTLTERLMTEARVLWFYARQILMPNQSAFGLYLDDFALSTSMLNPMTTLPAILGWGGVVAAIFYWRRQQPILCFAAAWFLVGHALESSFLPLEIAHEYRNYLPAIGVILGAGYAGMWILSRLKLSDRPILLKAVVVVPLLVCALLTLIRSSQMGHPLLWPQLEAAHHPQSARANYSAALTLIKSGYGDASDVQNGILIKSYLEQAGKADPNFKYGYLALIAWSCASGRPVEKEWAGELSRRLEYTPFGPRDHELPTHLLNPLLGLPNCLSRKDALNLFVAGANNRKNSKWVRGNFLESASYYEFKVAGDMQSARNYLEQATVVFPEDAALRQRLANFSNARNLPDNAKPEAK